MTFHPSRPRKFPAPKYAPGRIRSKEAGEPFALTAFDRPEFDCVAYEHSRSAGTEIQFYSQILDATTIHPAYGEPLPEGRVFRGPWKLKGWFAWTDSVPTIRVEGFTRSYDSQAWIARLEIEKEHAPQPKEGDVLLVWNTPFFQGADEDSVGDKIPKMSYYFDVVDSDDDGHLFDTPEFVGFTISLRRDSGYTPERRLNVVSER